MFLAKLALLVFVGGALQAADTTVGMGICPDPQNLPAFSIEMQAETTPSGVVTATAKLAVAPEPPAPGQWGGMATGWHVQIRVEVRRGDEVRVVKTRTVLVGTEPTKVFAQDLGEGLVDLTEGSYSVEFSISAAPSRGDSPSTTCYSQVEVRTLRVATPAVVGPAGGRRR